MEVASYEITCIEVKKISGGARLSRKSKSARFEFFKVLRACSMQTMQAGIHSINPEPQNALNDIKNAVFTVHVEPVGWMFEASAGMSLLQAAELAGQFGVELASSCRNGTCRTCICQLRSGQIIYLIEWPGLSLDEKRDGLILLCVAYPLSDVVMELPS